ncbi:uncharacterized protein SCHCODRAFT_02616863 [Schizophyllum commune H4-8]|uniref:Uncharacterized protein n=1 Tax=Schizophyllum commune (strain H4-8 / FGSC 9210) TaxID=578458 RepID=D8PY40_SCHCM|nr:uncharacterized protein SCHCODRAFT_02616863 [Schizophyllum commune H4-8]KAI5897166.1 hypothetical protein SCHCODRAFT_02616863 [Schizophyllum commune H4-8]
MSEEPTANGAPPVPLRTGPPTKEELAYYYPAKFTWKQLKTFINAGDLGLLKRDKALQKRYDAWSAGIKQKYGSMINFILNYRMEWGQPDCYSMISSQLDEHPPRSEPHDFPLLDKPRELPPIPPGTKPYFTADAPPEAICITQNDWPYSVPPEIEHTLIWSRLPMFHPDLVDPRVAPRVEKDGLWGFTGNTSPPPSPSTLPSALPALAEWGVTMDKLVRSEKPEDPAQRAEEDELVRRAGSEIDKFVRQRWNEREWETAWFVNPPRLQSIPGLAHVHVFARKKGPEEQ